MDGPENAVTRIIWALRTDLPGKLAHFRTRYGVRDGSLEDIDRYLTTEPQDIAVDKPPMIIVSEQESDTIKGPVKLTTDGVGGSLFEFRYRIGIFAWARGTNFETTALTRRRYGLAVRECLLNRPGLGDPDVGTLVIDPTRISETYSPIAQNGVSREVIAGTGILVEYRAQEYLEPRVPGVIAVDAVADVHP